MLNGHVRGGQNPVKNRGKESLVQAFLPPKEFILQLSHSGLPGSSRSVEAVLVRDGDSRCVLHLLRPNFLQRRGFFNSFESFDAAALTTKELGMATADACCTCYAPTIYSVAASSTVSKASMISPILTSLKFSRPTPHSLPLTTSLESSLKRLREEILPV